MNINVILKINNTIFDMIKHCLMHGNPGGRGLERAAGQLNGLLPEHGRNPIWTRESI
jgi:hypothetical protein